jgi:hypothetical protein
MQELFLPSVATLIVADKHRVTISDDGSEVKLYPCFRDSLHTGPEEPCAFSLSHGGLSNRAIGLTCSACNGSVFIPVSG